MSNNLNTKHHIYHIIKLLKLKGKEKKLKQLKKQDVLLKIDNNTNDSLISETMVTLETSLKC